MKSKTNPNEIKLNILGQEVSGITTINYKQDKKPYYIDVRLELSEDEYFKLCNAAGKIIPPNENSGTFVYNMDNKKHKLDKDWINLSFIQWLKLLKITSREK